MDISGRILLQTLITITDSKRKARSLHMLESGFFCISFAFLRVFSAYSGVIDRQQIYSAQTSDPDKNLSLPCSYKESPRLTRCRR